MSQLDKILSLIQQQQEQEQQKQQQQQQQQFFKLTSIREIE